MSELNKQPNAFSSLFEQAAQITKAHAYDIISERAQELQEENKNLKARIKFLENLIDEYTGKMLDNLKGKPDDIPADTFSKPQNS